MKSYSQNSEDLFILNYFGYYKGTLLDIGANDGVTFSNSRLLLENGWSGHLVEPGQEFDKLKLEYQHRGDIGLYNHGLGRKTEKIPFWQSGAHVKNGLDTGLVSTFNKSELSRWPDVQFTEMELPVYSFIEWYTFLNSPKFDFISIDAEGFDWNILEQINLRHTDTKCLCIEWNGDRTLKSNYEIHCNIFGLKLAHTNAENLIFCK